jgi:4-hydroxybenzoate polyprenyltransferase
VLGVIIGLYLGWKTHSVLIAAINFITSVALWFYSVALKKMPLTGNVLVSLLLALVLYFPWIFTLKMLKGFHPAEEVYGLQYQVANLMVECFASFAFLANLFREIVKDAEDIEGDAVRRCQTLPIIMGVKKIRIVLIVVLLIIFAQLVLFQLIFSQVKLTAAFRYFSFVLQPFLFILIYFTWISGVKKDFTRLSLLAKLLMLAGIIGMVFIAL